ncbi:hypothetical protein PPL_06611 [Heterostelium album PN500]|uniref:Ankyrin repeat protein n=1 Tax=Heterostelium pallidum (strain ATCC 26659 / Pp 5 / PN500) TaxID=670386 RepID=D3BF78_HETP5|nr:hypothetical protein PPL_06611 [Heterostelium album PN500]EFA79792.1 hypothetical protein PPL_06611 [Heterostelium album PN500]|eukprot:XP_020431913.1 hypothetical protein PPL_06611 [Heterostelium album PN500]
MSALKNHGNPEYPAVRMLLARYPPCRRNLFSRGSNHQSTGSAASNESSEASDARLDQQANSSVDCQRANQLLRNGECRFGDRKDGLEIIKYIAAKCVEPLTEKIIVNAAQHNRLDIIEYLMDNYRPTIKYTFHAPDAAAMYGNTDVFIYLMEKDKTVRYKLALNYAKTFHHHDILYYIRHKKRPIKQL